MRCHGGVTDFDAANEFLSEPFFSFWEKKRA
jgi:hypothetical protein